MMFWNTKAFLRSGERLIWCERERGQPAKPSPLSSPLLPSPLRVDSGFSSCPPHPHTFPSLVLFLPNSLLLLFSHHIPRLWAVIPAVNVVQRVTLSEVCVWRGCVPCVAEGCSCTIIIRPDRQIISHVKKFFF